VIFSTRVDRIGAASVILNVLYRVRKAVAVLLMTGSAVGLLVLFLWRGPALATSGLLVVAAALVVGTVGLARGAWWGRMVPIAWSTSVAVLSLVALALTRNVSRFDGLLAGAILLRVCVAGNAMFARHEGHAPPALDWTRPGMRLVRAAVTANLGAFLGGVTHALTMFDEPARRAPCCWGPCRHYHFPTVPFCVCLAMSALMLVGVVLLARQRTAGLLPAAVSAVGVPVVLIANHSVLGSEWALIFGPGIVCGWLVLGRFLPAMARFLRRSPG
jgi:hypothetical protein